jgi:hypothetical protein
VNVPSRKTAAADSNSAVQNGINVDAALLGPAAARTCRLTFGPEDADSYVPPNVLPTSPHRFSTRKMNTDMTLSPATSIMIIIPPVPQIRDHFRS